jgi:hypothetical protein
MRSGPRIRYDDRQDEEPPSPETVEREILARENQQLRARVRHLEGAVRCALQTLKPYAALKR